MLSTCERRRTPFVGALALVLVLAPACMSDPHVPDDLDVDRVCALLEATPALDSPSAVSEVARLFRIDRARLHADENGLYVPQSAYFVQERGIFLARPGAVLQEHSDPSFTRVRRCVYRYWIAG